jgi:hypothetical protein
MLAAAKKFSGVLGIPCAGHRLNLCVEDLFNTRNIKTKKNKHGDDIFFVKDFNIEGKLLERHLNINEIGEIEGTNAIKEISAVVKKAKSIVTSFKHSEKLNAQLKEAQKRHK